MKTQDLIKNAQERYKEANEQERLILETVYGTDTFKPKDVKERVKTLQDAFAELDSKKIVEITGFDSFAHFDNGTSMMPAHLVGYMKVCVIVAALNEGWTPDWDNNNEYKYYPWFYRSSSPGFSLDGCDYDLDDSTVGSRLCFKSKALSDYAATQFVDIYKAFFH